MPETSVIQLIPQQRTLDGKGAIVIAGINQGNALKVRIVLFGATMIGEVLPVDEE